MAERILKGRLAKIKRSDVVVCSAGMIDMQGAAGDPLTEEEMRAIGKLDRNCRLIKGQVFLWKDGLSWEALWDVNGEITPP